MTTLSQYKQAVDKDINETVGVLKAKSEGIETSKKKIESLDKKKEDNIQKKLILQEACKKARELSASSFAVISTNGVKNILGSHLEIEIDLDDKNGVPTADFYAKAKYGEYETKTSPAEEDGGGIADIVSLTNLLTMNILNSNINTAPIFLDEPTKYVSACHANDVGSFLRSISENFGKQIIMVTHAQETKNYSNKTFHVALDEKGSSKIEEEIVEAE